MINRKTGWSKWKRNVKNGKVWRLMIPLKIRAKTQAFVYNFETHPIYDEPPSKDKFINY